MEKTEFRLVPPEEYGALEGEIAALWHSAYDALLGAGQVDYIAPKRCARRRKGKIISIFAFWPAAKCAATAR